MNDILAEAEEILGPAVKIERHRGWAIFWCPFHGDADRAGQGGHPNFGVHLEDGHWKCLRCGAAGGSIRSLRSKLGKDWRPVTPTVGDRWQSPSPSRVDALDEAMSEARAHVRSSPAWAYLLERGIRPWTALVYGLGYGLPNPYVSRGTWQAAQDSMLIRGNGRWLWSGGVIYADPPSRPSVLNCRYIPADKLPAGERDFEPYENHHTWGRRVAPLGAWRINSTTRLLVVVEGLFDFLAFAQALNDRQRGDAIAVYTNGAAPAKVMQVWFAERPQYDYLLVRDPDEAGAGWAETLKIAVTSGGGKGRLVTPPGKMDPDEAIRAGWWPAGL